jgi:hypothetical protein
MAESETPSDNLNLERVQKPDNPPKKRSRWSFPVPTFSKIAAAVGATAVGAAVVIGLRNKARSAKTDGD